MNKQYVVHFGGGALGRGLVIPMLYESGKDVVLVDTNEEMLKELRKNMSYILDVSDDKEQRFHNIHIKAALSSLTQPELVIAYLKEATTITTAVRRENLKHIVGSIAQAWSEGDCSDRRIICCENVEGVGSYMKELLLEKATTSTAHENLRKVICPDTIVDRICASSCHDYKITSEVFHECSVDVCTLQDTGISKIPSVENIKGHFYRKRYLLNSYADAISFLARAKGLTYLYEAAMDEEIHQRVLPYMKLLSRLLEEVYNIPQKESQEWFQIYRKRLSNSNIPRELATVARNLWTKLSLEERFVQPLIQLKEKGIDIQVGLSFLSTLINTLQSETKDIKGGDEKKTFKEISVLLRELWCKNDVGKQLYKEFYEQYNMKVRT